MHHPRSTVCKECAVGRCVALEREHAMWWYEHDRYLALVRNLCFDLGCRLIFFMQGRTGPGTEWLKRAAVAGHKAAAYIIGVLCYKNGETRDDAKQFIRQVEGEVAPDGGSGHVQGFKAAMKANRECLRWRAEAVDAVRVVTWRADRGTVPLEDEDDVRHCEGSGCGIAEGWSNCTVFCSEDCRMRHEYSQFFWQCHVQADWFLYVINWVYPEGVGGSSTLPR
ncbi:hypothetical protein BS78_01G223400 [Paspalum vaginatum]|nr:hypothetical protein BS78_01G223400 [Paspalum vaginatum]